MCDSNKKKSKSKPKSVAPKKRMLKTDEVPANDSQILSNGSQLMNENAPPQSKTKLDRNEKIELLAQNNRSHSDQNATVIETLQNLSINHCTDVHIGNKIFHGQFTSSRKDNCDENNGNRTKEISKTVTGTK